jgi:hypothetical protein
MSAGTDTERQSRGAPGHCDECAEFGHVVAHPALGCADVGCNASHEAASGTAHEEAAVMISLGLDHGDSVGGAIERARRSVALTVATARRLGYLTERAAERYGAVLDALSAIESRTRPEAAS